jgi:integrase
MRGQGRVYKPKIGDRVTNVWWLDYSIRGTRHRESSELTSKRDALDLLRTKIGDRKSGKLRGQPHKVTLKDIKTALEASYASKKKRSWKRATYAFKNLEAYFGEDVRIVDIDDDRVSDYQVQRLRSGAARNTVRYDTAILNAALGVSEKKLGQLIKFKNVVVGKESIRQGFFKEGEIAAVVLHLPPEIADFIRFLYMTGWRPGEAVNLLWASVDWDDDHLDEHDEPVVGPNAAVRIRETKGGEDREYPFADAPELRDLLLARWRVRDGLHVFHRSGRRRGARPRRTGQPIGDFRKVWQRATKLAGCEGKLVYDLRRSAARDARRNGVSEGEIMKLQGWRTRSMFDRYNIIDQTDLRRAVSRRFAATPNAITNATSNANGKQAANNAVVAAQQG